MNAYLKRIIISSSLILMMTSLVGCGLDNYDAPQSRLKGQIVYEGRPLGLRSTTGAIQLQLYQDGYANQDPIPVYVNQNGEFSAQLFSGDYKLVTRDGNGPWVNSRDTLYIAVNGYTECSLEVTPYFLFDNYDLKLENESIHASALIERIVPDAQIEKVILVVGKTRFVDESTNLIQKRIIPDQLRIGSTLKLKSIKDYNENMHLFARLGVRAVGADQYVYTPVVELK